MSVAIWRFFSSARDTWWRAGGLCSKLSSGPECKRGLSSGLWILDLGLGLGLDNKSLLDELVKT